MATRKTTTTRTSTARKKASAVDEEVILSAPVKEEEVVAEKQKKFSDDDMIPCVSISSGEVLYEGEKSKRLYDWLGFGDVVDMEYRDLVVAVRTRCACVTKPRVIVQDKDFLKQNPQLEKIYGGLYSPDDLMNILNLPVGKMKTALKALPIGAQDSFKSLASSAIDDGVLDSVKKIKAIDEVFGTQLSIKMS